ncbi:MAG: hypothetical protein AAF745_18955 [Planctomycetota bacterium]
MDDSSKWKTKPAARISLAFRLRESMHLINRFAVPWGTVTGVLTGVLHQFMPREFGVPELIAVAVTPLLFPVLVYAVLRMHRDILKTDLDCSPFDPDANPLSIMPVRPINLLGALARLIAGGTIGLALVSFLNWPYNLLFTLLYGLITASLGLTVVGLPVLLKAPLPNDSTEPSDAPESPSRAS